MMSYISLLYLELYETKQFVKDATTGHPKLPPVLPLVLYNGQVRWHKALDVNDLIVESPLGLEPYRPHLRYCLIDEGAYDDQVLAELKNLVAALFRLGEQSKRGKYLCGITLRCTMACLSRTASITTEFHNVDR